MPDTSRPPGHDPLRAMRVFTALGADAPHDDQVIWSLRRKLIAFTAAMLYLFVAFAFLAPVASAEKGGDDAVISRQIAMSGDDDDDDDDDDTRTTTSDLRGTTRTKTSTGARDDTTRDPTRGTTTSQQRGTTGTRTTTRNGAGPLMTTRDKTASTTSNRMGTSRTGTTTADTATTTG